MKATILAPANHPDAPEGWPLVSRDIESAEELRPGETLFTDEELAAHIASVRPAYDAWKAAIVEPYLIVDMFDRFTPEERATIRAVARNNDAIADLWDKLLALREGVEGPPDGSTPGRAMAAQAKGACAQLFGQERADELFARA